MVPRACGAHSTLAPCRAPLSHWRLRAKAVRAPQHWVALELLWMQGLAGAAWQRLATRAAA